MKIEDHVKIVFSAHFDRKIDIFKTFVVETVLMSHYEVVTVSDNGRNIGKFIIISKDKFIVNGDPDMIETSFGNGLKVIFRDKCIVTLFGMVAL